MLQPTTVKRAILFLLFFVLIGVWGYNLYQLIPREETQPFRIAAKQSNKVPEKGKTPINEQLFSEVTLKEDPFTPFFKRVDTVRIVTIEKIAPAPDPPPAVKYLGLVKDKVGRNALIFLPAGGLTEIVDIRDEILGIRIIGFDEETLKYAYKGRIYSAILGENQ